MKHLLLAGLILALGSAPAATISVLPNGLTIHPINFDNTPETVSAEEIPEWALIPNAIGWYEVRLGLIRAEDRVLQVLLRGVIVASPELLAMGWVDYVALHIEDIWNPLGAATDQTPEPGTLFLFASGLAAGAYRLKRTSAGTPR